jgi:hypothetical protein
MAIIGPMDLGIGDTAPAAYVRVDNFVFRPEIPEIEIEIHSYYSKSARNLFIIKNFLKDYLQNNTVTADQMSWLQNNILCRAVAPLQTIKWATRDFKFFPELNVVLGGDSIKYMGDTIKIPTKVTVKPSITMNGDSVGLSYFYNWIKTRQVMGIIPTIKDDLTNSNMIISNFKSQHPEIFGDSK